MARQLDRDGTPLKELPPIWNGLTAKGVIPPIPQAQTEHLPNAPFAIDDPKGFNPAIDSGRQRPLAPILSEPNARSMAVKTTALSHTRIRARWSWAITTARKLPLWDVAQTLRARRQFLHGRVRRIISQSFSADLRLCAVLPTRRSQPGQGPDQRESRLMVSR